MQACRQAGNKIIQTLRIQQPIKYPVQSKQSRPLMARAKASAAWDEAAHSRPGKILSAKHTTANNYNTG